MGIGELETSFDTSTQERNALPQYGFGADIAFDQLVDSNPFLFRVHTPKDRAPHHENTEPFFVAQMFADNVSSSAWRSSGVSPYRTPSKYTYTDVARHMDWTTRSSSPYVSTSFSFAWAIWEATRRYHHSMKHSIEIAVIDAKALSGRAVTAVELLREGHPKDRHKDHWKWYRYALEAQDVLIWGYVPTTAVLATIPLTEILSKLPSYFLTPDPAPGKNSAIGRVAWDYERKKHSYRMFCQDLSERFLRLPVDRRVRDTTAGAARLAIGMLRPWFHRLATDDFTTATSTACELALSVARWPGLWWVREHPEIRDLVRCVVHIVGEEAREGRRTQALADAARMQEVVGGLEQLSLAYSARLGMASAYPTPRSERSSFSDVSLSTTLRESWTFPTLLKDEKPIQFSTPPKRRRNTSETVVEPEPEPEEAAADADRTLVEDDVFASPKPRSTTPASPHPAADPEPLSRTSSLALFFASDSEGESSLDYYARTASCLFTGFFIGTFITLCVLAPRRREFASFT